LRWLRCENHSSCLVHISETCSYLSISVHISAYARLCVHLPLISWFSAFLTSICPYMDEGAQSAVRVAGYWQFVTDTYDIHRYEQDMLMWVSYEEICTCEYLGEKYKQISTYLNDVTGFHFFRKRQYSVNIRENNAQFSWISVNILWISR